MTFDRSVRDIELHTILINLTDPAYEGLRAEFDPETGIATILHSSIEGQSAVRIPLAMVPGVQLLLDALQLEQEEG